MDILAVVKYNSHKEILEMYGFNEGLTLKAVPENPVISRGLETKFR